MEDEEIVRLEKLVRELGEGDALLGSKASLHTETCQFQAAEGQEPSHLSRASMVLTLLWKPTVRRNSRRFRSFSQFKLFCTLGDWIGVDEAGRRLLAYSIAPSKNREMLAVS